MQDAGSLEDAYYEKNQKNWRPQTPCPQLKRGHNMPLAPPHVLHSLHKYV